MYCFPHLTDGCRSVVDQDTDRWVAEALSTPIRRKMEEEEELEKTDQKQWTEIVCA